jgi:hypothetical protein
LLLENTTNIWFIIQTFFNIQTFEQFKKIGQFHIKPIKVPAGLESLTSLIATTKKAEKMHR